MTWREPKNHFGECCFRCVSVTGFSAMNKHNIVQAYTNLNSEMRPIAHDDSLRVPEPPENGLVLLEQNVKTAFTCSHSVLFKRSVYPRGLQNKNDLISRK